jgi:elongation factor P
MLTFTEVRKGTAVVLEGEPYIVLIAEFLRKQQRRPVVRATLKHLRTGQTREHTFMQSDKIQEADIERRMWQFLYHTGDRFVFMDTTTYEQMELGTAVVGNAAPFLLEGQDAEMLLFAGAPVSLELPIKIERRIVDTSPGVKGDTATNVMKDAVVEGGVRVKVPLFIKMGDVIRINTRDNSYVERASA